MKATIMNNNHEIVRAAYEVATSAVTAAPAVAYWLHLLQEANIVLITVSALLSCCIGAHGLWRIVRSYRGKPTGRRR